MPRKLCTSKVSGTEATQSGWLVVGLAVSAVLFVRAMPHSPLRGPSEQVRSVAVSTTSTLAQGTTASVGVSGKQPETVYVRKLITQPIETIRVGQRVLGTNPNRDEVEPFEEPDPKTWRTIEVEQIKPSGKRLYATLLRPREWIEEKLDPETNTIDLDLPELGAEGPAQVLRIGPCPPIAAGAGHIVTATFKHEPDGELLTLTIGDDDIGCTANHPFWSEDRQAFVEAGQLHVGERVRTRLDEVAAVVAIKPRPPTAWVYNLEVQGEHVYEVGPNGILVHNKCIVYRVLRPDENPAIGLFAKNPLAEYTVEAHVRNGSRYATQYISTTTDIEVARKWAAKHGARIVAIDLDKVRKSGAEIIKLTTDRLRDKWLRSPVAKNFARASKEVVIKGSIPKDAIISYVK
jgi:hypothetical protein